MSANRDESGGEASAEMTQQPRYQYCTCMMLNTSRGKGKGGIESQLGFNLDSLLVNFSFKPIDALINSFITVVL